MATEINAVPFPEQENDVQVIYPSPKDEQGYFFASKSDEDMGIRTKEYENGSATKTVKLSTGVEAVIRKLKGRDFLNTKKMIQSDNSMDFEVANLAISTTIDGKQQPYEFYLDDLFQPDFALLFIAYNLVNFQ